MAFQKQVNTQQALGQPGEFYDASARRSTAYRLASSGKANVIGHVFTVSGDGTVTVGGTGSVAGVLCNPKVYARPTLDAAAALPDGTPVEIADLGRLIVRTKTAAEPKNYVAYDQGTGEIRASASETPPAGCALVPGAKFILFSADAGGLAVIQL